MIAKKLVKEVNVNNNEDGESGNFSLKYYLTNTENNIYGIEIEKNQDDLANEVRCLNDILQTKEQTLQLLEQLAKNQVTPVTFDYVIEDFWGIY
jgi:hypothetical protein